jgi:hypothetical protein
MGMFCFGSGFNGSYGHFFQVIPLSSLSGGCNGGPSYYSFLIVLTLSIINSHHLENISMTSNK